jgi:drug/metabolite transporter (DMT)-like permease
MYYLPFIGAIALAGGTVGQKLVLKIKKIDIKTYQVLEFLAIVLVMLPFIYFFWHISPEALTLKSIIIFAVVILFSILANLFTYYSMKWEKVTNLEPAKVLEPLLVILLAIVFSFFMPALYDKNTAVIVPAIIAGLALIFANVKKHHLEFNKYVIAAILGSFFFALELVTSILILNYFSPMTFYFIRAVSILSISLILFRPKMITKINNKLKLRMLLIGVFWVLYRVMLYYGYLNLGVIFTTLIIMLGPVFVYLFAWIFIKDRPGWKNLAASAVIIGCVIYATLM